jgi:hypothetical protein
VGFPDRQGRDAPWGWGDLLCSITRIGPSAFPIRSQYKYAKVVREKPEAFHPGTRYFAAPNFAAAAARIQRANKKATYKA